MRSKIIGSGRSHSMNSISNLDFKDHKFFDDQGNELTDTLKVIDKLNQITGIKERQYAKKEIVASDLAFEAAQSAIENAGIDPESIDYIVVANNYGDIPYGSNQPDMVPSLASRVKHLLGIKNSKCIAYDIIFGCAGWIEAWIHSDAFIRAGLAKRCLVIGADTLSRIVDHADRDSMIFADGAGAIVLDVTIEDSGFISSISATYANEEVDYIYFGKSNNPSLVQNERFIKMNGRKIYEFAIKEVPAAMKACLEKSEIEIHELKKVFIHQANEKMDYAILERFYKLYNQSLPEGVMPMNIDKYGNSSVATIPTLLDLVKRGEIEGQTISEGDVILFASVGAGMSINAIAYRV